MLEMIYQGGYLMIPIILCSILAVMFTIERFLFLRISLQDTEEFWNSIEPPLKEGDWKQAREKVDDFQGYLPDIVARGLEADSKDPAVIRDEMEDYGMKLTPQLEKFLPALNFIAQVSPLLGLLGTVSGMIQTFSSIAQGGVGKPELLAGGISQALVTTASGLTVGILALFFHHLISGKVDAILHNMKLGIRRLESIASERQSTSEDSN